MKRIFKAELTSAIQLEGVFVVILVGAATVITEVSIELVFTVSHVEQVIDVCSSPRK